MHFFISISFVLVFFGFLSHMPKKKFNKKKTIFRNFNFHIYPKIEWLKQIQLQCYYFFFFLEKTYLFISHFSNAKINTKTQSLQLNAQYR